MKIRSVGAEFFHADGQTDMNRIVAFSNFANAPIKVMCRTEFICCYTQLRNRKKFPFQQLTEQF
jgi:hypothetical protein